MYILAIETTGAAASVALINEEGLISSEATGERLNHLQNLMLMTEKLLDDSKLSIGDVSCIGVSEGPGSFTGIRIGVSTARALSQALNIPIISVPTLKTFVYNIDHYKGIICPIFDARRNQVYSGAYVWDRQGINITEKIKGDAYSILEIFEELEKSTTGQDTEIMFFGDGITVYEEQILNWAEKVSASGLKVTFAPENIRYQKASSTACMALELFKHDRATSYENIKPVYMRQAEAQRKLDEGILTAYK
ncbi:MAG: tRNA (adenosine(37)-N6)-threonylcarbamoyltransferase complex dimerization subunit type 1 TsaB [Peptostreptococcaceae bacterium]|nr:tRNA (adenosine(37)-N6)-threonylcarbamoyltransferase complex dimerization subunit type 1 TsaB [Peptostreptococcaceae bacterium]